MLTDPEIQKRLNNRRSFIKMMAAAPLFATIASRSLADTVATTKAKPLGTNVYSRLGVRPFINGRGTWTYLSGSLELPEVRQAAEQASRQFVDMFELQRAAGKRLAELSGAESGMVTSGSAGAMASATAACIAGSDPKNIWQLPDTTGLKHEVVMLGGRSAFDSAIRLAGGTLVLAPGLDDLQPALTPQTAMVYTTWRDDRLAKALQVTRAAGVPLLVDDAAGIPPFENLSRYAKMGVDLYCFSGGKGFRGPQCAGLLLGRKDLIDAALANTCPWEGAVCRAMKVGKEEIMGMLAAVDYWSRTDLAALNKEWETRVKRIEKLVTTVPGVTTTITIPKEGNSYPTLTVNWNEEQFGLTVAQCDQQLREGEPRIEVLTNNNPSLVPAVHEGADPKKSQKKHPNQLQIISMTLQPGEDLIVGNRLRRVLEAARKRSA
ncbi:MAG TPA: aminotransferase class V-fold PLP-dependent enzyme [Acidobacteriaceae bacterium]|jgi:L-seryl-tRNA(Ser) seleniumtransferase|nr:aminotransferase class V-fold PLP-dependent enzyme [Acidobacteriaceae bacterium]